MTKYLVKSVSDFLTFVEKEKEQEEQAFNYSDFIYRGQVR
jgi:hypothetical protein